jgi:3-oxoadipate enol-lactonase
MVGMWLATYRSDLIKKLVLCNTSALLGPRENWEARIAAVRQGGMQTVVQTVLERWFTGPFRKKYPEILARTEKSFLAVSVEGYCGCCAAIRDMDQRETISRIHAETMVITGTYDPSTPPAMGQYIAETIRGSRYVEFPTAHLSNIEAAPIFNDVVSHFLKA